jgi:hypothetical protein
LRFFFSPSGAGAAAALLDVFLAALAPSAFAGTLDAVDAGALAAVDAGYRGQINTDDTNTGVDKSLSEALSVRWWIFDGGGCLFKQEKNQCKYNMRQIHVNIQITGLRAQMMEVGGKRIFVIGSRVEL